jgi:hypothetical protein
VTTNQDQLDAFRQIENATPYPGGKEPYPGGPPRVIDLTAHEPDRAFHDSAR